MSHPIEVNKTIVVYARGNLRSGLAERAMEHHKKERSSRQHMKIEYSREREDTEMNGGLLLSNPMCNDLPAGTPTGMHGRSSTERGSFKKSRPKSPSLLRFFVRPRKVSADEDECASSGSDHEDPFSVRGAHYSRCFNVLLCLV